LQLIVFYVSVRGVTNHKLCFRRRGFIRFVLRWRVFAAEVSLAAIYYNLDVIVLSWWAGEYAVGLYSAAARVVRLASVFAQTYTSAVFPLLSKLHQKSKQEFEKVSLETIRLMAVIAIPIVVCTTLLADRVIGTLYFSGKYTEAVPVLQVLIWILISEFLNPFISRTLSAKEMQDRPLIVAAIGLAVNLVATLSLVPIYGAVGAAMGTVISNSVAMVCLLMFAFRREEITSTIHSVIRVGLASVVVGFLVVMIGDINLAVIAAVTIPLYLVLIYLLKVIGQQDWELMKSIVASRKAA
jgi:O-antigen/teichoic acid export membrane protein